MFFIRPSLILFFVLFLLSSCAGHTLLMTKKINPHYKKIELDEQKKPFVAASFFCNDKGKEFILISQYIPDVGNDDRSPTGRAFDSYLRDKQQIPHLNTNGTQKTCPKEGYPKWLQWNQELLEKQKKFRKAHMVQK